MKQATFTDIEYSGPKKKTKRKEFLEIMDEIIPWEEWVDVIKPYYPKGKRGLGVLCGSSAESKTGGSMVWVPLCVYNISPFHVVGRKKQCKQPCAGLACTASIF